MKDHELKCWPQYFDQLIWGRKPFEYRRNDRGFLIGDTLYLREWDKTDGYTGRRMRLLVTGFFSGIPGMPTEYCIMTVRILQVWEVEEDEHSKTAIG